MKIDTIYNGEALDVLKTLPDESINMCITSPPYWALRDYGVDGQLGLEPTFTEYINRLCDIFDEVHRVLTKDGSCWVNLGDTYMGDSSYSEKGKQGFGNDKIGMMHKKPYLDPKNPIESKLRGREHIKQCLKSKSLCMIPERFAIEMINRGWILRNQVIWSKPNAMPCSVKDRFTVDFEKLFFFTKNRKYFFKQQVTNKYNTARDTLNKIKSPSSVATSKYGKIEVEQKHRQGMHKNRGTNYVEKRDLPTQKIFVDKLRKHFTLNDIVAKGIKQTTASHWFRYDESGFSYPTVEEWKKVESDLFPELLDVRYGLDSIKESDACINLRTTWRIPTKPFSEAHFAVYPEALIKIPVDAGCPEGGVVLDPFFGSGTTGVVALKQLKHYVGIELNQEYINIAKKRLKEHKEQKRLKHFNL